MLENVRGLKKKRKKKTLRNKFKPRRANGKQRTEEAPKKKQNKNLK